MILYVFFICTFNFSFRPFTCIGSCELTIYWLTLKVQYFGFLGFLCRVLYIMVDLVAYSEPCKVLFIAGTFYIWHWSLPFCFIARGRIGFWCFKSMSIWFAICCLSALLPCNSVPPHKMKWKWYGLRYQYAWTKDDSTKIPFRNGWQWNYRAGPVRGLICINDGIWTSPGFLFSI